MHDFNQKAHGMLVQLICELEQIIVKKHNCSSYEANVFLTKIYIENISSILSGGCQYLRDEELIGIKNFLIYIISFKKNKRKYYIKLKLITNILFLRDRLYFPMYKSTLFSEYRKALLVTRSRSDLRMNGVAQLAAAKIPGVKFDLQRELQLRADRERGARFQPAALKHHQNAAFAFAAQADSGCKGDA